MELLCCSLDRLINAISVAVAPAAGALTSAINVFLLTSVAVSYLAILGYWEKSMQTFALSARLR